MLQEFKKDDRVRLDRKELFKNTLRKASHAWKRIIELRLTGMFPDMVANCNTIRPILFPVGDNCIVQVMRLTHC